MLLSTQDAIQRDSFLPFRDGCWMMSSRIIVSSLRVSAMIFVSRLESPSDNCARHPAGLGRIAGHSENGPRQRVGTRVTHSY
jgi:hypothetical protein